ncbi:hypothetical protein KFL_002060110 [Klebsormidium nitens]|uniref:Uncharacterized protein n=1 Tax=Klebsormidium nitens TaxID=105231 RepID=A0A1Y1I5V8_KLENI|nr:hypothetical protein KFL_002060110 [Klebsormidium nitens]|eukprot:GAQ84789.1 hypothetical protein KFL_002060110 [Klebsormidium nitens]
MCGLADQETPRNDKPEPEVPSAVASQLAWEEAFERYFESPKAAAVPTSKQQPGEHAKQAFPEAVAPAPLSPCPHGPSIDGLNLDPIFRCDDISSYQDEEELIPAQAGLLDAYRSGSHTDSPKVSPPARLSTGVGCHIPGPGVFNRAPMTNGVSNGPTGQKGRRMTKTICPGDRDQKRLKLAERLPGNKDGATDGGPHLKEAGNEDGSAFWTQYENPEYDRDDPSSF